MDKDINPVLNAIIKIQPDSSWLFVEIGACYGDISRWMYSKFRCSCVAVEPDKNRHENCWLQSYHLPINAIHGAVGNVNDLVRYSRIYNKENDEYGGNIAGWRNGYVVDAYDVQCYKWDMFITYCCNSVVPSLVFMDCEGSEPDIVPQICESSFKPPRIIIEWHVAFYHEKVRDDLIQQMKAYYTHKTLFYMPDNTTNFPLYGDFKLK